MLQSLRSWRVFLTFLGILMLASLACTNPIAKLTSKSDQSSGAADSDDGKVTTDKSSKNSKDQGFSRANPYPIGELVSLPGWDIRVIEFLRGEEALKILNTGSWQAEPLPEGSEYAVAKIFVRCTSMDENSHSISGSNMPISGSSNLLYSDNMDGWPAPEFVYEDMYTAEAVEGWIDVVIPKDEHDLMLMYRDEYAETPILRFFELEPGASIKSSGDSAKANDLGISLESPAEIGQTAITSAWEITISNAIRGEEAAAILQKNNDYYEAPQAGEEFLLLEAQFRYFGETDVPVSLGSDNFSIVDELGFGFSTGRVGYWLPTNPDYPWLATQVLPVSTASGWVVYLVPQGRSLLYILVDPEMYSSFTPDHANIRYFILK